MTTKPTDNKMLPPSPFVRHFSEMLHYGPLNVIDVGCCQGRNALHLAKMGHSVVGLSIDVDDLLVAKRQAEPNLKLLAADARRLPVRGVFDVVLMNEVLHQIPKPENKLVLNSLKKLVKPGGVHAISDYIGDKPNALRPNELYKAYATPEWVIIEYNEDPMAAIQHGENEELTSLASIIAVRN